MANAGIARTLSLAMGTAGMLTLGGGAASAQDAEVTMRVQTYLSAESVAGVNATQFFDDVETMSGGRIDMEGFFSSAVVKSVEAFDAAINGILDADMSTSGYQVGKDTAFQFISDINGGYETPWQMYAWLYNGGGLELARELHAEYGLHFVGWWIQGPESLSSTRSLEGLESLKNFKFRSPPGLMTKMFADLGASPIVMDFTEIFTALESGIIDGTDAATLSTNQSLGLYDIAKHATYPGFHSMPAEHLSIRMDVWEGMAPDLQRIIEVGVQKLGFRTSLDYMIDIQRAAAELTEKGVTLYDWSPEDRQQFRENAIAAWDDFADTETAKTMVESHKTYMRQIGLLGADE